MYFQEFSSKQSQSCPRCRFRKEDLSILEHASQCDGTNCKPPGLAACESMRCKIFHNQFCDQQNGDGCGLCKQFISLCYQHGELCNKSFCSVPFCTEIQTRCLQLQKTITPDQRNHAVDLLLEVITATIPFPFQQIPHLRKCSAQEKERDIFRMADTPKDYYRILASVKWEMEMLMDLEDRQRFQTRMSPIPCDGVMVIVNMPPRSNLLDLTKQNHRHP